MQVIDIKNGEKYNVPKIDIHFFKDLYLDPLNGVDSINLIIL